MRLSIPDLVKERGVKLGLQLLVAVALDNLCYFLLPPHVRRVVQVTFQTLSPAHIDDRLANEKPWMQKQEFIRSKRSNGGQSGKCVQRNFMKCIISTTVKISPSDEIRVQKI